MRFLLVSLALDKAPVWQDFENLDTKNMIDVSINDFLILRKK